MNANIPPASLNRTFLDNRGNRYELFSVPEKEVKQNQQKKLTVEGQAELTKRLTKGTTLNLSNSPTPTKTKTSDKKSAAEIAQLIERLTRSQVTTTQQETETEGHSTSCNQEKKTSSKEIKTLIDKLSQPKHTREKHHYTPTPKGDK